MHDAGRIDLVILGATGLGGMVKYFPGRGSGIHEQDRHPDCQYADQDLFGLRMEHVPGDFSTAWARLRKTFIR